MIEEMELAISGMSSSAGIKIVDREPTPLPDPLRLPLSSVRCEGMVPMEGAGEVDREGTEARFNASLTLE